MFYVDWELEMQTKLRVGIFLGKKLVMVGLYETNNFFGPIRPK